MPANLENSAVATGLEKVSFHTNPKERAMPKNVQTTAQLYSSHTLVRWCSKFATPGFNNTWTVNFQMFKLVLKKAEDPEIKLPTSAGSSKKQESSRKTSAAAAKSLQLCPTLCNPIDNSPPGSSIHGIFQAGVLQWAAIAFSEKNIYFSLLTMPKPLTVWPQQTLKNSEWDGNPRRPDLPFKKSVCRSGSNS